MPKRILYYAWGAYNDDIFINKLKSMGYELVFIRTKCEHYTRDMNLASEFMLSINENKVDSVVSFDYFPIISMICDVCKIPYYSWVYDSPHKTLQAKCVTLPCNHISVFDRALVDKMNAEGIRTVKHLPLAADAEFFSDVIAKNKTDYSCDISFLGSLYTDSHNYYSQLKNKDDIWKLFDEVTQSQAFDYVRDKITDFLSDNRKGYEYLKDAVIKAGLILDEDYNENYYDTVADNVLKKRVTIIERQRLLEEVTALSEIEKFRFRLFTASDVSGLKGLDKPKSMGGPVDYLTQMPVVFHQSRINLNITLRSISTGIPLRAIDILASGGFLLTNPQAEFSEYLTEGVDYEVYRSIDECLDKIRYYLDNEEKRIKIANSGRKKARECFSYEHLIPGLLY